jgi:cell division protein FtsB
MTKPVERLKLKRASRILWSVLAVLLIVLISAFSRAFKTNQSLRQELETLRPVVTAAAEEQKTLTAELAYVQSDEYIEKWSREHAAMTKPDEVLVVTVKTPSAQAPIQTPTVAPDIPTPTPTQVPFWQRWWETLTSRLPIR